MNKRLKFEKFIPIAKVDDEERMVYGYASTPQLDSDGEIIKSSAFEKALPNYMKFPTIREMHQPKPAGTTKQADISKKGLYIGAKIVADEAWKLVKEGVYAGFSIGGNVVKRVGNVIEELELVEISLVDVPANKGAVIEIWKKEKITKDAESAYSLANLIIRIKDEISWYKYKGKDTKKLSKCLEMLKQLLSTEALEAESEDGGSGEGIFYANDADMLKSKISLLEAMDFEKNSIADTLRKGVIIGMTKANIKKEEEVKDESEETTTEEETSTEEETAETTDSEKGTEDEAGDADSEKGADSTLTKLQNLEKQVSKMVPSKEQTVKAESLTKAIDTMAGILTKMVDLTKSMEGRIANLEKTPAKTKSKSALVFKNATEKEEKSETVAEENSALALKKARFAELDKEFDKIGANEFAKRGLSKEAMDLTREIAELEHNAQG